MRIIYFMTSAYHEKYLVKKKTKNYIIFKFNKFLCINEFKKIVKSLNINKSKLIKESSFGDEGYYRINYCAYIKNNCRRHHPHNLQRCPQKTQKIIRLLFSSPLRS